MARVLQFCEELVDLYNFHRFDNLRHSERKTDPRKRPSSSPSPSPGGQSPAGGLWEGAVAGDTAALRRCFLAGVNMDLRYNTLKILCLS